MAGLGIDAGILNVLIAPKLVDDFASSMGGQLEKTLTPLAENAGTNFSEKMGKSMTKAGAKLTAGLTAPILALGALTIKSALDMDEALDGVRVKTGLTGKAFEDLSNSMLNVRKNVPQSLAEIGDIMSDISIKTSLTGKPLEALTTQFAQFNKVTGKELNAKDTLDAFKLLGVGAKDYSSTLDKILRASQFAGVGADELTGQLKSQASTLNALGFSFDQSISYVATFAKAGLDSGTIFAGFKRSIMESTKAGQDMIKLQEDLASISDAYAKAQLAESSATARLNEVKANKKSTTADIIIAENNLKAVQLEMNNIDKERISLTTQITDATKNLTTAQKDAPAFFAETISKIKEYLALGNETEAMKVASVFGKSAIGIIDAIKQGGFEIQTAYDKIAFGSETVSKVYKDTMDFTDQLTIFKNRMSDAFGKIGTELFPALETAISTLLPPILGVVEAFGKLDPNVQAIIIGALAFTAAIGPLVTTIGGLITAGAALSTLLAGLGIGLGAFLLTAGLVVLAIAAIAGTIYLIWHFRDQITDAMATAIEFVIRKFNELKDIIPVTWNLMIQAIALKWQEFVDGIKDKIDGIKKFLTTGMDEIKKIMVGIGKAFIKPFVDFENKIKEILTSIPNKFTELKNKIIQIVNSIKTVIGNVFDKITSLPGFTKLFSVLNSLGGIVAKAIGTRASGGPVSANTPYLVGEKGPEIVVPRSNGTVIPNNAIGKINGNNYQIIINNPISEASSTSIPNALRRVAYLKGVN